MSGTARHEEAAAAVERAIAELADPVRAAGAARFFKTGPGEYGEGDRFVIETPGGGGYGQNKL